MFYYSLITLGVTDGTMLNRNGNQIREMEGIQLFVFKWDKIMIVTGASLEQPDLNYINHNVESNCLILCRRRRNLYSFFSYSSFGG